MEELPTWVVIATSAAAGVGGALSGSFWTRNRTAAEAETLRLQQQNENWASLFVEQRAISAQREETIRNMAAEIREYKQLTDDQVREIAQQARQIAKLEQRLLEMETKISALASKETI